MNVLYYFRIWTRFVFFENFLIQEGSFTYYVCNIKNGWSFYLSTPFPLFPSPFLSLVNFFFSNSEHFNMKRTKLGLNEIPEPGREKKNFGIPELTDSWISREIPVLGPVSWKPKTNLKPFPFLLYVICERLQISIRFPF